MIVTVPETGSTNAVLAARLHAGDPVAEGEWLVADRQTAGRGRLGRTWYDGAGNFMGSTVVQARAGDPPLHTLALVAGLAVHSAVSGFLDGAVELRLKWPNDLLVGPAKLAGILLERARDRVVVGVGVNLVQAPVVEGRETAALVDLGPAPARDTFARALAQTFAAEVAAWRERGLAETIARWSGLAHPVGTGLVIGDDGEPPVRGDFAGLDDGGALILRLPDGTKRTVHAGEVRLAPAPQKESGNAAGD